MHGKMNVECRSWNGISGEMLLMFLSSFNDSLKKMKRGEIKPDLVAKTTGFVFCLVIYLLIYLFTNKGLGIFRQFSQPG